MHSIRHATVAHLLKQGADICYVRELPGYEDLKTMQINTLLQEDNIKAVYRMYHPRGNEYYRELGSDYLNEALALKQWLIEGKQRSEE